VSVARMISLASFVYKILTSTSAFVRACFKAAIALSCSRP